MKRISIKKVSLSKSTPMSDIYKEYVSRYTQKANQIQQRFGTNMYADNLLERGFKMVFEDMKDKHPTMSANRIVDKIISTQSSKLQWNSAKALAETQGISINPYNLEKIRFDKAFMMDEIKNTYHILIQEHTSKEASHLISSFYFGSP